MKIRVVGKGVAVDHGLQSFIQDKVSSRLEKLSHRVRWVRILLEDTNGPRGGLDKRCVVSVGGDKLPTRLVDVRDTGLHGAIAGALELVARSVVRALERERTVFGGRLGGATRSRAVQ